MWGWGLGGSRIRKLFLTIFLVISSNLKQQEISSDQFSRHSSQFILLSIFFLSPMGEGGGLKNQKNITDQFSCHFCQIFSVSNWGRDKIFLGQLGFFCPHFSRPQLEGGGGLNCLAFSANLGQLGFFYVDPE